MTLGGRTSGRTRIPATSDLPGNRVRASRSASGIPTATMVIVASDATRSESQKGPSSLMRCTNGRQAELAQNSLPFFTEHEFRERLRLGRLTRGAHDAESLNDRIVLTV